MPRDCFYYLTPSSSTACDCGSQKARKRPRRHVTPRRVRVGYSYRAMPLQDRVPDWVVQEIHLPLRPQLVLLQLQRPSPRHLLEIKHLFRVRHRMTLERCCWVRSSVVYSVRVRYLPIYHVTVPTILPFGLLECHCLTDRRTVSPALCHCPVPPISYEPPLTLTAPPIAFLRARGYGPSRISRKQLHNIRMDTSRLEKPVRFEVCMTCHVPKLDGLNACFQQGRCKVESDEEC